GPIAPGPRRVARPDAGLARRPGRRAGPARRHRPAGGRGGATLRPEVRAPARSLLHPLRPAARRRDARRPEAAQIFVLLYVFIIGWFHPEAEAAQKRIGVVAGSAARRQLF